LPWPRTAAVTRGSSASAPSSSAGPAMCRWGGHLGMPGWPHARRSVHRDDPD
jgi:hypothetical protein